MKWLDKVESVGWVFFAVLFALLAVPGAYLGWVGTYDTIPLYARLSLGAIFAMVLAAFLTFGLNDLLYRRTARRHAAERNSERKRERKAKRGR
jgi:hypothetical protein